MTPQKTISLLAAHKKLKEAGYISNVPENILNEWRKVAKQFKKDLEKDLEENAEELNELFEEWDKI
jgi:hypothetical protein